KTQFSLYCHDRRYKGCVTNRGQKSQALLQGAGKNGFLAVGQSPTAKNQSKKGICMMVVLLLPRFETHSDIRVRFKTGVKISGAPTGRRRKVIFCGVAAPRRKKLLKEKAFV
ncbi:MAG: hypothetical protein RBT75_15360, partial [Anaerolineae bacterium]|nr:hypothetical protein [Anaerolineae bacterium]